MNYTIETDVPIPTNVRKKSMYPFDEMEVGDSFFADSSSVRASAISYGRRADAKFTVRKEGDGFRVWRIA